MPKLLLYLVSLFLSVAALAQNVGINTSGATPDNSALLDMNTGNTFTSPKGKGLLIPNVPLASSTDATTIGSPAASLLVYNTGTGGLAPAGYYYNSGTSASPVWVAINKTHVIISEGMSPPSSMAGGDGHTYGYGSFDIASWSPTSSILYEVATNPGTGAYFAPANETIYNVSVAGWVLNKTGGFSTNVTVYLMQYSLGTSQIASWSTGTVAPVGGTYIGASTASMALPIDAVDYFNFTIPSVTLTKGDVLILFLKSNNSGSYLFYTQAQLEFDVFN